MMSDYTYEDERARLSALIDRMNGLADELLQNFDTNDKQVNFTGSALRSAANRLQDELNDWDAEYD